MGTMRNKPTQPHVTAIDSLEEQLFAIANVSAEMPTHRANLRRSLLSSRANKQYSLAAVYRAIFKSGLFFLTLGIIAVIVFFNVSVTLPDLNNQQTPAGDKSEQVARVEIKTKEELLIKAEEALRERKTSGKYRQLEYVLETFSDSGKTRKVKVEITKDTKTVNPDGTFEGDIFLQIVTRDFETGRIISATKTLHHTFIEDYIVPRTELSFGTEQREYKAGQRYIIFLRCDECSQAEVQRLNDNRPATPEWELKHMNDDQSQYLKGSGSCGTGDGVRVLIECYGMQFVGAVPMYGNDQSLDPFKSTSKADFIERVQLVGYEKVLVPNVNDPRFETSVLEDKVYKLLDFTPMFATNRIELIEAIKSEPMAKYIGMQEIEGRQVGIVEYEAEGITGKFKYNIGYDLDTFDLAHIHKQRIEDDKLLTTYKLQINKIDYVDETAPINY